MSAPAREERAAPLFVVKNLLNLVDPMVGTVARAEGARVGAQLAGASVNTSPPSTASAVVPRLRAAVEQIRRRAREERALGSGRRVHVLVTGSLYLVGDMLRILGRAG